ncbi:unnamed protein product [Gongylonema pulchrum]|uniref:Transmembrane protein n=1 Tax=Gongylonema pulchrum TaxID=637853 RepID=A0A183D0Y4_9BILA|nr:unnamed protein product [Gongylonema pulchrum]
MWSTPGAIVLVMALLAPVICIVFGVLLYNVRQRQNSKIIKVAHGKFMDTSRRIFNEQRVQKSRLYYDPATAISAASDEDEYTPLKTKRDGNRTPSVNSSKSFTLTRDTGTMQNLYSREDGLVDETSAVSSFRGASIECGVAANGKLYDNLPETSSRTLRAVPTSTVNVRSITSAHEDESQFWLPGNVSASKASNGGIILSNCAMGAPSEMQLSELQCAEDLMQARAITETGADGSSRNSHVCSSADSCFLRTFKSHTPNTTTSFMCSPFSRMLPVTSDEDIRHACYCE